MCRGKVVLGRGSPCFEETQVVSPVGGLWVTGGSGPAHCDAVGARTAASGTQRHVLDGARSREATVLGLPALCPPVPPPAGSRGARPGRPGACCWGGLDSTLSQRGSQCSGGFPSVQIRDQNVGP